jgi:hypothetical protein
VRRGPPLHQGRLPAPGAAARQGEGRARQRRGSRRGDEGQARPLQRDQHGDVRAHGRRQDDEADGGDGPLQDKIDAPTAGNSTAARDRDGRAALPARRRRRRASSRAASRRVALCRCCCRSPTCCCSTSRPTTSTPSRSPGWSAPARVPGTVVSSPTIATSSTTSPAGSSSSIAATASPYEGNYSSWLEQKKKRLEEKKKSRQQAPEDARARAGVGARLAEGPPGEEQGPLNAYESWSAENGDERERLPDPIPPGERLGNIVVGRAPRKGYGDQAAVRRPDVQAAAAAASSASSAPTAPARRRCSA